MLAATVYLVTNKIDGKTYVGVTRFKPKSRWTQHLYKAKHAPTTHFHKAINKYGAENFSVTAIASCLDSAFVSAVEREVIKSFNPIYNQTNGGEITVGKRVPREVVERIIAANKGKKRTAEQKKANSDRAKARYLSNPEWKANVLEALVRARLNCDHEKRKAAAGKSARERVWSKESRAKLSASCMGRKYSREVIERGAAKNRKMVECTTLHTVFDCCEDAAEALGFGSSSIYKVLAGARESVWGLNFVYV